jgi:hypothetical protein
VRRGFEFKAEEALRPCLALYLIVAIAVNRKMKVAVELGGKEPDLSRTIHLVAAFGGYPGRKNDGPPGSQSMRQGPTRVRIVAIAWEAFGN